MIDVIKNIPSIIFTILLGLVKLIEIIAISILVVVAITLVVFAFIKLWFIWVPIVCLFGLWLLGDEFT